MIVIVVSWLKKWIIWLLLPLKKTQFKLICHIMDGIFNNRKFAAGQGEKEWNSVSVVGLWFSIMNCKSCCKSRWRIICAHLPSVFPALTTEVKARFLLFWPSALMSVTQYPHPLSYFSLVLLWQSQRPMTVTRGLGINHTDLATTSVCVWLNMCVTIFLRVTIGYEEHSFSSLDPGNANGFAKRFAGKWGI